ncbi:MAG: type II secretion system F family protein [Spartobacteria bacterium]|nr:type II secretion system F family protein [Spartobacteria bacterium]
MSTYAYTGYDSGGKHCKGMVEAVSEKDARDVLFSTGVYVDRLQPVAGTGHGMSRSSLKTTLLADYYRELAVLLQAGLTLNAAFDVLLATPEWTAQFGLFAGIRDAMRDGASFCKAMEQMMPAMGTMDLALIRVGEQSGALADVLEKLAVYHEVQREVHERIRTAMIYPSVVMVMAVVIALLVLGVMLPRFTALLEEVRIDLPRASRVIISVGYFMGWMGALVPLLVAMGLVFWRKAGSSNPWCQRRRDMFFMRSAWVRKWTHPLYRMRFASAVSLMLHGGMPLLDAVLSASASTGNVLVAEMMEKEADAIRHGASFSSALRRVDVLNEGLPGWVQAGEASGALEALMLHASERYRREWERAVTRTLSWFEPVIILSVGLFVLFLALAILMPVMSLNSSIMP